MAIQIGKSTKRSRPNHVYSIVSITLVLFLLGILGMVLVYSNTISRFLKEQTEMSIYIKEDITEVDIRKFRKQLEGEPFVLEATFVNKEQAAEIFSEQEETFPKGVELIGYNPLPNSINILMKSDYVNLDSMAMIKKEIMAQNPMVDDVFYWENAVSVIENITTKVGVALAILSAILFIIALILIDNTIRLAMYSNRFLIRSMQLVGATRWFIIKPFVNRSVVNGVISGLIAVAGLFGLLYFTQARFPYLLTGQSDILSFVIIFLFVLIVGVIISWGSTFLAISKYLRMKLDDLY